jgi:ferredoxin
MPYVVTAECILCGACVAGCQSNAITEGETQSHINVTLCVECGTCEANCPVQAIIYVEESEFKAQAGAAQPTPSGEEKQPKES